MSGSARIPGQGQAPPTYTIAPGQQPQYVVAGQGMQQVQYTAPTQYVRVGGQQAQPYVVAGGPQPQPQPQSPATYLPTTAPRAAVGPAAAAWPSAVQPAGAQGVTYQGAAVQLPRGAPGGAVLPQQAAAAAAAPRGGAAAAAPAPAAAAAQAQAAGQGQVAALFRATVTPKLPVLIVPGFMSSGLHVEETNIDRSFVGARVWLDLAKLGFQAMHAEGIWANDGHTKLKNKWLQHLLLKSPMGEKDGVTVRAVPGLHGVDFLSEGLFTAPATYVFGPVIKALKSKGYVEHKDMEAASYDWRLAPRALHERDGHWEGMKQLIEGLNTNGTGVVLLAHSMGNCATHYFLKWAKENYGQVWLDKHIHTWVAAGAPILGAPAAFKATMLGDKMGLDQFLSNDEALIMGRNFSSSPWLWPIGPQAEGVCYVRRQGLLEIKDVAAKLGSRFLRPGSGLRITIDVHLKKHSHKLATEKNYNAWHSGKFKRVEFDGNESYIHVGGPEELPPDARVTATLEELPVGSRLQCRCGLKCLCCCGLYGLVEGLVPRYERTSSHDFLLDIQKRSSPQDYIDVELPVGRNYWNLLRKDSVTMKIRWRSWEELQRDWLGEGRPLCPRPSREPLSLHHGGLTGMRLAMERIEQKVSKFVDEKIDMAVEATAAVTHYDGVAKEAAGVVEGAKARVEETYKKVVGSEGEEYSEAGYLEMMAMEACDGPLKAWQELYVDDPLHNSDGALTDAPPCRRVTAIHGINVKTPVAFALRLNTFRYDSNAVQTRFVLDDAAQLTSGDRAHLSISEGIIYAEPGMPSGDGTVPHLSSHSAQHWSNQVELKTVHIEGAPHRDMLSDARFHRAVFDTLTPAEVPGCRLRLCLIGLKARASHVPALDDQGPRPLLACARFVYRGQENDRMDADGDGHVSMGEIFTRMTATTVPGEQVITSKPLCQISKQTMEGASCQFSCDFSGASMRDKVCEVVLDNAEDLPFVVLELQVLVAHNELPWPGGSCSASPDVGLELASSKLTCKPISERVATGAASGEHIFPLHIVGSKELGELRCAWSWQADEAAATRKPSGGFWNRTPTPTAQ